MPVRNRTSGAAKKAPAKKAAAKSPTAKKGPVKAVAKGAKKVTGQMAMDGEDRRFAELSGDHANRRPDIEAYLDSKGVKWIYHEHVKFDDIDMERSLRNQARIHKKLDEEVVDRYLEAMSRGDVFPPLIGARAGRSDSKLVNVDGNHRAASSKKKGDAFYPYGYYEIVDADPQIIVLMTFEANTKHGLPTSEEERVHQAIWLIDNGANQKQAAAAVNVPERAIKKLWNKVVADRRADEVGILRSHWDHLSQSIRQRLVTVATDEGFRALTELTFRAKLDWDEVNRLVNELNASRSGTKQAAMVENWVNVYADRIQANLGGVGTSNSRKGATPKQRYQLALGSVLALPDDPSSLTNMFAAGERAEAARKAREAAKKFTAMAKALEAAS